MKRIVLIAGLTLGACGPQSPEQVEAAQQDQVLNAVRAGSGEACTNPATIQTVRDIILGKTGGAPGYWPEDQASQFRSELQTGLEMITLAAVDSATSRVSCSGTFVATWQGEGGEAPIAYSVQPALDTDNFIVEVEDTRPPQYAVSMAAGKFHTAEIQPAISARQEAERVVQVYKNGAEICADFMRRGYHDAYGSSYSTEYWLRDAPTPINAEQTATYECVQRAHVTPRPEEQSPAPPENRIEMTAPPEPQ